MSAGREFQVDGALELQQKKRDGPVRCVYEEQRVSEHRKSAEPELVHWVCASSLRYVGLAVVRPFNLVSLYSQFIGDPLPHRKPV